MRTFIYLFSLPDFCAILQRMTLNYDHEIIILSISSSPEVKLNSQALIKNGQIEMKTQSELELNQYDGIGLNNLISELR